jgi:two-component system response regulator AtoC
MKANLLIVDDEEHTRHGLELALEDEFEVFTASNAEEALSALNEEEFQVVLTDLRMPGESGMTVIDQSIIHPSKPLCIMMTAYGEVTLAVEAIKRGAFDFLPKPVNLEQLEFLIKRGLKEQSQTKENIHVQKVDNKYKFDGILGKSASLESVMEKVRLVGPTKTTVLFTGETGTGKELFAHAIHQNSERKNAPFVPVHCAALPANLLESELFGHEKGSFTGASEKRIGRFESANGGTLFLDEIGEIDASTQVKLLRFLESKTIERIGSSKSLDLDVRLVCATNRNLLEMSQAGEFREDLYYRLNVVSIELPPLRQRGDDIMLLLHHFLHTFSEENGFQSPLLSADTISILKNYSWPGNIRELRNFAENLVVLKRGQEITPQDLDPRFSVVLTSESSVSSGNPSLSKEENEKNLLRNALLEAHGNRTKASELLGISRRTLHRKLDKWPELDDR